MPKRLDRSSPAALRCLAVALLIACGPGCRRAEERPAPPAAAIPTPAAAAAEVGPAGTPAPEPTWTPEPPRPRAEALAPATPTEAPTMRPTIDLAAAIPNFDRPRDLPPKSRREQLSQCLSFTARPRMTHSANNRVQLVVTARNSCVSWVPVDDSSFDVEAFPYGSPGTAGRETGRFQSAIPPSAWAETLIEIDCPGGQCRYVVSVSGAGGGRKPE